MATAPVSTAQATQTLNAGIGTLAQNYETFLHLLTTQLKNQDPLSPLDTNQFTQQLTAMTGVQQQLLTNQLLTQMIGQNQSTLGGAAIGLIGKTVTAETDNTTLVDGQAAWSYNLDAAPAQLKLEVLDGNGKVVTTFTPQDKGKGLHELVWDGKNALGQPMPDGVYRLRITATDSGGKTVGSSVGVTGVATRVETINGETTITIGRSKAPLSAVTAVSETT